jgi:hypothetical protein
MCRNYFFLILSLFTNSLSAQIFGGNPDSIKWKQINKPESRIIFPKGLDSVALRVSNIIDLINETSDSPGNSNSSKINIVLQNQNTTANGYVSLGPFRSEFYLTPDQNSFDLGSLSPEDQLTLHEYKHVQQYIEFNAGLSKFMHLLFGQEGQVIANNTAIPNWFFEGGAVFNETFLSKQGRGRLPHFFNDFRALWKDGKEYSWMKIRNGSYKDFVPDHYPLGYMLVAYGRQKYGDQFWDSVTHDAASFKGLFYPFQQAVKKYSGKNYVQFRTEALDFFKDQFANESETGEKNSKEYVDDQYPSFDAEGSLVFVKSGFKQVPKFVVEKDGKETKLRGQDFSIDNYFSYKNGMIVYAASRPDLRWGYRTFNDIRIINAKTGIEKTLTNKKRYFSPDISESGEKFVAVNQSTSGSVNLDILSAKTGKILEAIPNPDQLYYTYPKFFSENKIISAVRNRKGEMSLAIVDLVKNSIEYLLPFTFNVTGFPVAFNDTIYFSHTFHENDELFSYTLADNKIWKIETGNNAGVGKYSPAVNDTKIAWSSFTSNGFRIQTALKSDLKFIEILPQALSNSTPDFGISALRSDVSNFLSAVPDDSFSIYRYKKAFRLFNFHSIEPAVNDPQYTLSLVGENILNTMQSSVSATYDRTEKFKRIGFGATYGGWFPLLSAGLNYTIDRKAFYHGNTVYFNQIEPYAGFSIPLNFSNRRSFTHLNFGSQYIFNKTNYTRLYKDSLNTLSYSYLSNFLTFSNQIQKAKQQIFPRLAQTISLNYKTALTTFDANQFVARGSLYLPGFLKTHSIVLQGGFLQKDRSDKISFSSGFPFSRGYQSVNLYKMNEWGINYHLPVIYPEAGFASIIYFLRVRANFFYDNTYVKDFANNTDFTAKFRSVGTEINFDTKWWNQANISFGFRYSHLLDSDIFGGSGSDRWEIILPVNIFQ